ncbi:hypothetical protein HPP92_024266 [Vanilla planifolia]|uniref:Pentatricopeptide repeat-containing protein n=1 Tax=Vanilla planifolia TaxID=51239 RepID=A0A835PJX9_VANPL|nr:hypothetical protein HPP92_024593 [Vanilla planifolia]KAG0456478.1 hypothetical protein HPP92_024266 [Vanilla planifolia]
MTVGSFLECEPDRHTFHLAVSACTRLSEFELGFMIGDRARARGVHSDLLVATALIDMYEKAGDLDSARLVFDEMAVKDAVSWNAMISGSLRAGLFLEAVELFRKMNLCGLRMTEGSLVSVISLCSDMAWFRNGEALHARVIVTGFDGYQFVLNSLLEMYGQFSRLDAAVKLFDRMAVKDSVSWSTMIGGYFKNGHPFEALKIFWWLILNAGILPTRPMLLNALLACASLGDWQTGKWIGKYLSESSNEIAFDSTLKTTIIYMYAKCRKMEITLDLLESDTRVKGDVIAWNAVIKACVETGEFHQVFELSLKMQRKGILPDTASFLMLLSVVSAAHLPRKGAETHAFVIKIGFDLERAIANALLDMYAQIGRPEDSYHIFNAIHEKDVISWTSMIRAYAWNGNATGAFDLFSLMKEKETKPNHFTFLALLSACSHGGFVEKGTGLLASMENEYGLKPGIEHLACMFDLFCRAGHVDEAYHLLKDVALESSAVLWGSLLSSCRLHGNLVIGKAAASHLFLLEPRNAANYLMLADIYIFLGQRADANVLLRLLKEKGLENRLSYSLSDGGQIGLLDNE